MRFLKDGPVIPDELLIARDEGRVVFFCGAGVSKAFADLPSFFSLADAVIDKLGVPEDSSIKTILNKVKELQGTEVGGLISVDRVFGLLEREFSMHDIESAVAQILKPKENIDPSAHETLVKLATTPEGKVRLVTTNYDRLFESCFHEPKIWCCPRLPDPTRDDEMDGIIYLHGRANKNYDGSEGDGFILSSSGFGRAYLSEGWATDFFQQILSSHYMLVFVGYAAEDPPVHYLLEALNKKGISLEGVYAFQAGLEENETSSSWRAKGVQPIPYLKKEDHKALWNTLEAWAERAKDPDGWYDSVVNLAKGGPKKLQPHERGQVAHVISTSNGVRSFSSGDDPPPAEWLCVFDPAIRYGRPGFVGKFMEEEQYIDPFDLYCLDDDIQPPKIGPKEYYITREVPREAWDGFNLNRLDQKNLGERNYSAIRGNFSINPPLLPTRLEEINIWLMKISNQPTTLWWAAKQMGLHLNTQERIRFQLERSSKGTNLVIRKAWWYLFEIWREFKNVYRNDWHSLKLMIKDEGWSSSLIIEFAKINRPYLIVETKWYRSVPPEWKKDLKIDDMFNLDVEYPSTLQDAKIPDEWLSFTIKELRKNLEHALYLETEIEGYDLNNICPIIPDKSPGIRFHGRREGLSGNVIYFSELYKRLIEYDIESARNEFESWDVNDDYIFCRLRIWASGYENLVSNIEFKNVILGLSSNAFWDIQHQRDFLLTLAKRWGNLSKSIQKKIENRLLQGPEKWEWENDNEFERIKSISILERMHWLENNGCEFTFDLEKQTKKIQRKDLDWKPEYAICAAQSMEVRGGGIVNERPEYDELINIPVNHILNKALTLMSIKENDYLVKYSPFKGLSEERPARAFLALSKAAKEGEFPKWAWNIFLDSETRKNDRPVFSALIAERIFKYSDNVIANLTNSITRWLTNVGKSLYSSFPLSFNKIASKIINIISEKPAMGKSVLSRNNNDPDWVMEAINSPAGKIAQILFDIPNIKTDKGLSEEWKSYVNKLLLLRNDNRRYVLVILGYSLDWLYLVDPSWSETNVLIILKEGCKHDRDAIWSGFFWQGKLPSSDLYVRIKPNLLNYVKQHGMSGKYIKVLPGIVTAGWGTIISKKERYVSNNEMHDVLLKGDENFRINVLRHIRSWMDNDEGSTKWYDLSLEFLRDVWPKQKAVKCPKVSALMFEIAFSNYKYFPEIADVVLSLLSEVGRENLLFVDLLDNKNKIIDQHPERSLALLHAVLPNNVYIWPHGVEDILKIIVEADSNLKYDARYLEIKKKWDSR